MKHVSLGKVFRLFLCVCLCFISTRGFAAEPPETVDSLIGKNEQARRRIESASYVIEFEHHFSRDYFNGKDLPAEYRAPLERKGKVQVIQKGNLRFTDLTEHVRFADGGPDEDNENRAVIANDFSAAWLEGTALAYQWDHKPGGAVAEKELLAGLSGPEILKYCFGADSIDLKTLRERNPDAQSWRIQEQAQPDGGKVFSVGFLRSTDGKAPQLVSTYILDPSRGFMITSALGYDPAGAVVAKRQIVLKKVDPAGVWFPQEVTLESPEKSTKLVAKNVKVNAPVEDSQFTIAALRLPNGQRVARTLIDGTLTSSTYEDGKLIPMKRPAAPKAWLGIRAIPVTEPETQKTLKASGYKGDKGVLIDEVYPGSPADGVLLPGDVLTKLDGEEIQDIQSLYKRTVGLEPGHEVELTLFREGRSQTVRVTLAPAPNRR